MRFWVAAVLAVSVAVGAGCGRSSVGRACETHQDCDNGQTCYTELAGGFCSRGCDLQGSIANCPDGTICSPFGDRLLCAPICQAQGDCREGYECNGLSGTEVKSCRPKA
jgi:hypothetical protein